MQNFEISTTPECLKLNQYIAKVSFSYQGEIEIKAENYQEAKMFIEKYFYMLHGTAKFDSTIKSETEDIPSIDWRFPIHPQKTLESLLVVNQLTIDYSI